MEGKNWLNYVESLYKAYLVAESSSDMYEFDKKLRSVLGGYGIEELDNFKSFSDTMNAIVKYAFLDKLVAIGHTHLNIGSANKIKSQVSMRWTIMPTEDGYQIRTYNDNPGQNAYVLPRPTESIEAGGVIIVYLKNEQLLALSSHLVDGKLRLQDIGQHRITK